ncbi:MAG TPA: tetratricopeptide repeat protein, partial [Gemmataceae bacterium]|nr:tetratricopeptide repeat protein [Gemmataceae bacterium]
MKWWRKGIGKHVSAELTLGDAYHNGWGVPRDDAEALRWWKQEDWHPVAQLEIGDAYHNGWGVTRDDIEAVRWWRKSADQGGWRGILAIANAYRNDWGVQKDNAQEYLWLSLTKQIGCWGEDPQHVKQWQEWERKYPSMIRNALDGEPNRASAALQVLTRAMTPDEIEQGHLL